MDALLERSVHKIPAPRAPPPPTREAHRSEVRLDLILAVFLQAIFAAFLHATPARAQQQATSPKTETVIAGEAYSTSHAGQDWLLGAAYRDLWAEPIEVEVLSLTDTAGGLSPVMRVGGLQTLGLALAGGDGRSYTFRSVNKGALLMLPEGFRDTGLETIIQDQVSSALPGGELIAAELARAVGVLHADSRLVVMPDDPSLAEYRQDFAGVVGTFYEFPTAGSFGSAESRESRKDALVLVRPKKDYDRATK